MYGGLNVLFILIFLHPEPISRLLVLNACVFASVLQLTSVYIAKTSDFAVNLLRIELMLFNKCGRIKASNCFHNEL